MKKEENKLICNVLTGRAGCGKTQHMLGEIAIQPGKYVLATPRKELLEEHAKTLREMSGETSTTLVVECIHSDQPAREKVGRRITDALRSAAPDVHAVTSITHQALFELDPRILQGWHIRIDELPDGGIVSGSVKLSASWHSLAALYKLKPSNRPGWSIAYPREDITELQRSEITTDVSEGLIGLHRALTTASRTVHINIKEWKDASLKRRVVKWWSIWSPADLSGCASLSIAAANYQNSLVDHAVRKGDTLSVKICPVDSHIERTRTPQIRIHYYTKHAGSTTWWQTDEGSYCLVQISRHLEAIGFVSVRCGTRGLRFRRQQVSFRSMGGDPRLDLVDAVAGECGTRLFTHAVDPDQAFLRVHVDDDVVQGVFICSEVGGDPGQREDGAHLVALHWVMSAAA